MMHTPCGHINQYWASISTAIEDKMNGIKLQLQLDGVESELTVRTVGNQNKIKACKSGHTTKVRTTDGSRDEMATSDIHFFSTFFNVQDIQRKLQKICKEIRSEAGRAWKAALLADVK